MILQDKGVCTPSGQIFRVSKQIGLGLVKSGKVNRLRVSVCDLQNNLCILILARLTWFDIALPLVAGHIQDKGCNSNDPVNEKSWFRVESLPNLNPQILPGNLVLEDANKIDFESFVLL
jgi:hypothetical protein